MAIYQRYFQNKTLILAILGITISIYIALAKYSQGTGNKTVDNSAVSLKLHKSVYVIVIDAGSTASRVNIFTFRTSVGNGELILNETSFYETKPGLTFYAKHALNVGEPLNILLEKAKLEIPQMFWPSTPVILRATAGLRLLPDKESRSILKECKRVLGNSGFKVSNDSVAIMSGSDEGIFSWFTTNFILKRFSITDKNRDFVKNTVTALDLGGGSTQITFAVKSNYSFNNQSDLLPIHAKNIYRVNTFNRNISVFTESFLGLGLMAARKEILSHPDNYKNDNKSNLIRQTDNNELRAECINPIITKFNWNYDGKNYAVKGPLNGAYKIIKKNVHTDYDERKPVVRFTTCLRIIKKVIDTAIPHKMPSLREHEIYAFSYYFERATEAGLVDPQDGGIVTIQSIYKSASEICAYPNVDQPFMCLDLSFIYVLLHYKFGLPKRSNIFMHQHIDGHQLNWALGAAFSILEIRT